MNAPSDTAEIDQALKAKHRAMWALGDYPSVAAEIIPDLGTVLVEACGVGPRHRVLDVAAGSGNAAIPAALSGASVVACDLTPELSTRAEILPPGTAWTWNGARRMPKRSRSMMASSTWSCLASGSCSLLTTRPLLTSWLASAAPVGPSVYSAGLQKDSSVRCSAR